MGTFELPSGSSRTNLTTLARIRTLSGFRPKRVVDGVLGQGNGSNVVFAPQQYAVFVSPTYDSPQNEEVVVCVDGSPVAVVGINESTVVLSSPPDDGSRVTATYWGHNLPNSDVSIVRAEVESEVFGRLRALYTMEQLATSPVVGRVVAYLAAAILGDEAYNDAGNATAGAVFPPDRLRKTAYKILDDVVSGAIELVDESMTPIEASIENWMADSTYSDSDRLFERDPFDVDSRGRLVNRGSEPWRHNS